MNLKDIVKKYKWSDIKKTFLNLYPDQKKSIKGYEKVFNNLLKLKLAKNKMQIKVYLTKDPDEKPYARVNGYDGTTHDGIENSWAIEFMPWKKWLGMEIMPEVFYQFSEKEIISHCLYEMTYCGYNESQVQKKAKELHKRAKSVMKKYGRK